MNYLLHDGHHLHVEGYGYIIRLIGGLHLVFLHFPIAFILGAFIAELLNLCHKRPLFDSAARFMLLAAAIISLPTALLGLALSYGVTYKDELYTAYSIHLILGFAIALLSIITFLLRGREKGAYWFALILLVGLVLITGFIGGIMSFGLDFLVPKSS